MILRKEEGERVRERNREGRKSAIVCLSFQSENLIIFLKNNEKPPHQNKRKRRLREREPQGEEDKNSRLDV